MTLQFGLLEILRQSFTLVILGACSVVLLGFALERWLYFRKIRVDAAALARSMEEFLSSGAFDKAGALAAKTPGPLGRVAQVTLANRGRRKENLGELVAASKVEARVELEKYLNVLGTLANAAPFVGLFGTVVGIIKAFQDLAAAGTGGPAIVAAGIAEALIATAGGMAVAIPATVFYNHFNRQVRVAAAAMDALQLKLFAYLGATEK